MAKRKLVFMGYFYEPKFKNKSNSVKYSCYRETGKIILFGEESKSIPRRAYSFDSLKEMIRFTEKERK